MNTLEQVQARLERFEFDALFVETLGWAAASQGAQVALPGAEAFSGLGCRVMAHTATQTALEVIVPDVWRLTRALRQQIFAAVAQQVPGPLLIFVHLGTRSLWLWSETAGQASCLCSQVYIKAQPGQSWAKRLVGLCQPGRDGSGELVLAPDGPAEQALRASLESLAEGIGGISLRSDRKHYALVVFCRLLATLPLQQAGWLDQGDEWYLHNRFGQSQQQGADRFFREVLQPLWFQGFALPPQERLPHLPALLGEVPFLPTGPFHLHPLEQQYGQIEIADQAFEPVLEWLGDLATSVPPSQLAGALAPLLERFVNQLTARPGDLVWATPAPILAALCDRTLEAAVLRQASAGGAAASPSMEDLLMALEGAQAQQLLNHLVTLAILDPACGSGRYLLMVLQRLAGICEILAAIVRAAPAEHLPAWLGKGWPNLPLAPTLAIECQILNGSFYGVDLSAAAVELARLQFFLHLVGQLPQPHGLSKLPDLSLNLLRGNSLVGLIKVDSERFDQIQDKAQTVGEDPEGPVETAPVALQGNLLQPLLAEDYRSILAERQIRLEHYRSQTHLFSEVDGIPGYVQAEFLRDRILELNRTAQTRLNQLLLSEFSQQLGIRYRQVDRQGRQQRRLLGAADIAALSPFHWGFYGHQVLSRGGFDVVICQPPWGALQGSPEGFFAAFEDLFERKGITLEAFCHHRKQLLTIDSDLATAWRDYSGQFTYLSDYFRRALGYQVSAQPPPTQAQMRLYKARLLLERAQQLLRPGGIGAFLLPADLWHQDNAERLRAWLHAENHILAVVELSNHQGGLGPVPTRTAVSLLWLEKTGPGEDASETTPTEGHEAAPTYSHSVYQGQDAPTAEALSCLLQSSIDLPKEGFKAS